MARLLVETPDGRATLHLRRSHGAHRYDDAHLLVDIGNTRVKWATLRDGRQGRMRAAAHEDSGLALRALVRSAPRDVSRVVVVSVVDEALSRVLDAAARRRFGVMPEYIRFDAAARAASPTVIAIPGASGADRWVSAIGAHALAAARAVVDRQRRHRAHHRCRHRRAVGIAAAPSFPAPRPWWRACSPAPMASAAARSGGACRIALAVRHRHRERPGRGLDVRRRGVHRPRVRRGAARTEGQAAAVPHRRRGAAPCGAI